MHTKKELKISIQDELSNCELHVYVKGKQLNEGNDLFLFCSAEIEYLYGIQGMSTNQIFLASLGHDLSNSQLDPITLQKSQTCKYLYLSHIYFLDMQLYIEHDSMKNTCS